MGGDELLVGGFNLIQLDLNIIWRPLTLAHYQGLHKLLFKKFSYDPKFFSLTLIDA